MTDPELLAHRQWLGYVQPVGVLVSPTALVAAQAYVNRNIAPTQQLLFDVIDDKPSGSVISDLRKLVTHVLRWENADLVDSADELQCALPEYNEVLRATYAVRDPEPSHGASLWIMLVKVLPTGCDLDRATAADDRNWQASPEAKFERLLREVQIPIGLITNGTNIRLVYAPRGETSGYITFPVGAMTEVAGRPILAALEMLLCAERVFTLPEGQRLPAILAESRRYQNEVSTRLAGQVLAGLYQLLRGFQAADSEAHGELLRYALQENPDLVYEGMLTVLLRLVFLLYAEDRDLMPVEDVYTIHYSLGGLFDRLRADAARYPDTMDQRYGAWAQLLSLFRLIFDGVRYGHMRLPARHGNLFDPDRFPFLEGRPHGNPRVMGETIKAPFISDGVIWRVIQNLVVLDGERLSYRSLDVEQIGSVYETVMGFRLEIAYGHSLALRASKPHGAPITINVDELLATAAESRAQRVRDQAELSLTEKEAAALAKAAVLAEVEVALDRKVDRRATPTMVSPGAMILQPNEERRRSGSFYTPRSLTEPIVRATLRPIFDRLGEKPTPAAILDLKVCDPAMGSGAFLVEACRQLADKLVDAWHAHNAVPPIPPDSDELLHARRLVAHRCLYGVDRNSIAVDLAKLSLWLATLARDHAFTFLDHALRCGDSLVGLKPDQIVAFHWEPARQKDVVTRALLRDKLADAESLRKQIRDAGDDVDVAAMRYLLRDADDALEDLRLLGDLVILAFFEGSKPRDRQSRRDDLAQKVWAWQRGGDATGLRSLVADMRHQRALMPFHWQIEFPEVFDDGRHGFDAFIGNPPFMAKNAVATLGESYREFLALTPETNGKSDIVAFFFRRAFDYLAVNGCMGLVATDTIAKGDTRAAGLTPICSKFGGKIFSANTGVPWPGAAMVRVSIVHISKGPVAESPVLNGRNVDRITAFLFSSGTDTDPTRLRANANLSFQGCNISGQGFLFADDTLGATRTSVMRDLIAKRPEIAEAVFPYLGGADINSSPTLHSGRFVIGFGHRSLDDCRERWPELVDIVARLVKPDRERRPKNSQQAYLAARWWQWHTDRPSLQAAAATLGRVLVGAQTTAHLAFVFVPRSTVAAHSLNVFALDTYAAFCAMQSRVHEIWARFFGSALGQTLRYTPTDCFETFPFPQNWLHEPPLEAAGQAYYEFRGAVMASNAEGITKTYNRFHDPNEADVKIVRLRQLHDVLDRAVLETYGWGDIQAETTFLPDSEAEGENAQNRTWLLRWPKAVEEEVLERLFALNSERAAAERLQFGDESTVKAGSSLGGNELALERA